MDEDFTPVAAHTLREGDITQYGLVMEIKHRDGEVVAELAENPLDWRGERWTFGETERVGVLVRAGRRVRVAA